MSEHLATIAWERGDAPFTGGRYGRGHRWTFDGGITVPASASPRVVPPPHSVPGAVDPEEAFVAALASCHMLWFLSLAAEAGHVVERYRDEASGTLGEDGDGHPAITAVILRPRVAFAPDAAPSEDAHHALHEAAHEACFLARSVRAELRCEPARMVEQDRPS